MNVLLAEANVPYEQLNDLDEANRRPRPHRRRAGRRRERRHQPGGPPARQRRVRHADPRRRPGPQRHRHQAVDGPRVRRHRQRALHRPARPACSSPTRRPGLTAIAVGGQDAGRLSRQVRTFDGELVTGGPSATDRPTVDRDEEVDGVPDPDPWSGGQGVVTAAELLSVAAFGEGRHAQAFPSFGSERTGAPVVAFCRIDDRPIRLREPVLDPDALIIAGRDAVAAGRCASPACDRTAMCCSTPRGPGPSSGWPTSCDRLPRGHARHRAGHRAGAWPTSDGRCPTRPCSAASPR